MACIGYEKVELSVQSVLSHFKNGTEGVVSSLPPVKPKGGEVYLFSSENDPSKKG